MESDDINENQNLTSLEQIMKNQLSGDTTVESTNTGRTETAGLVSKSASELLQGMIQYAKSASENTKEASSKGISIKISKSKTYSGTKFSIVNHPLLHTETPVGKDQGNYSERQINSLVEQVSPSTETVWSTKSKMLSRVADKPLSDSGLLQIPVKVPHSASLKTSTVGVTEFPVSSESVPDRSSQLLPNVLSNPTQSTFLPTTYSCVYVQDRNNGSQNKVAFLVPQVSLKTDLNYLADLTSSILSKTPMTEPQTPVTSAFSGSVASSAEISNNNNEISFKDRISKLVTDTVDSFYLQGNDLKDSNLLKVSTPRNKESLLNTVHCSVCGDGYIDKDCLDFHLNRTVFNLLYYCSQCKQKHTFYNKCSLWMHLRKLKSDLSLNYSNIIWLKPYEFDAEDSSGNEISEAVDNALLETSECVYSNSGECRVDGTPTSTTASVEKVTETESACHTTVSTSSRKRKSSSNPSQCPICVQSFSDLSAHLCRATAKPFPCSSCDMFLPSICAQEAHMNIHRGVAKKICCPECGEKDFTIVHEGNEMRCVFDHVDDCKHFNRILSIQCFCKQEFNDVDRLEEHLMEHHFRTIFKCPLCVLAFTQRDNFVQHAANIHKAKNTNIKVSVLCLICQRVLKSYAELKVHLDQYVDRFIIDAKFKWKCFICSKTFSDKTELNKHTEVDHPHKSKRCTNCYNLFWSRNSLVEHILNYCIDVQADEPKRSSKSIYLRKLFEVNKMNHDVDKTQRQLNHAPVVKKYPLLVKIAPKVVSKPGQSVLSLQSQPQPEKNIKISQSVTMQKETPTEVSSTGNKLATQPCKIIITSKGDSTPFRKSITVSQCMVCKQIVESIKMTEHLKFHQSQGVIICCHCFKRDFATIEAAQKHSELCGSSVSKQAEKPAEIMPENSKEDDKTPEANSKSRESNGEEPSVHQEMENDEKSVENETLSVFPCLVCGLAFQSLSAREEHVSRSHDGIRIVYHCGLCRKKGTTKIFSRKELVSRHITKKHRIGNMDTVNRFIRAEEQNASSGQKLQISKTVEDVPAPKRLRLAGEGDYMCGKCGFSCAQSQEFSQHITSHNSSKEPQCPECGLCFTIFAALKKHLLAVHKIHAVDDYLKANNVAEPDLDEFEVFPEIQPYYKPQPKFLDPGREKSNTASKVASSNPLECTVCYRAFDVEANLKTHMRNHGMAFIRSKRHKV
ncbi:unnamed protein product [Candidula unifasciata]|uniref:C2H2-type domain-containing protein n=1 Tax=Candidula unifasciata TaxID=100452 RepID=A0A8S3Z0R1_9EUPU|nr:unnamed protein product [Candidula unifasciata]